MRVLQVLFGIFVGACIGASIEVMQGWYKAMVAGIFGGLALITLVLMGLLKLSEILWPKRDNWYATSSYPHEFPPDNPQIAINKNRSEQWRSCDPQEEYAWFEVDMNKPRTIASIEFLADDHDIEKPKKWRMTFFGVDNNGLKQTLGHKDGEYNIFVRGRDIPNPIQWFKVEIKEIAEDMEANTNYAKQHGTKVHWTIALIRLKEYRFNMFGKRFCEHEL